MNALKLSRQNTLELLSIVESLPTLPDRFLKIQNIINDRNSGANDIAKIIQTDQATTIMVMKIASSPAFNPMNQTINTLSQAIARLGINETADIALSMSLLYGFAIPAGIAHVRAFWTHAYAVGLLSKHLIKKLPAHHDSPPPETMFLAGLLHDIGKAILGIRIDFAYFETPALQGYGEELYAAELETYGMSHGEVGEIIMTQWQLPDEIIKTASGCHNHGDYIGAKVCAIADTFAHDKLASYASIESVSAALTGGLFEMAEERLVEAGLLPPPVKEEEKEDVKS